MKNKITHHISLVSCNSLSLFVIMLFLLKSESYYSANRDSIINSYWRNGFKKTSTIYTVKHKKYDKHTNLTLLKKKKTLYYSPHGVKVSKSEFEFDYRNYNYTDMEDSLLIEKIIATKVKNIKDSLSNELANVYHTRLKLVRNADTLFLNLINTRDTIYVEKDTLIKNLNYYIKVFIINSAIKDSLNYNFIGALRSLEYKVYFYDTATMTEKLIFDADKWFSDYLVNLIASKFDRARLGNINGNRLNNFVSKSGAFILGSAIRLIFDKRH
ncbi:MAG: hypothetical protein SFY56_08740 [Bacteroidota bacterium]|nr:hypothetical protein [Bacteroidota bacterium]